MSSDTEISAEDYNLFITDSVSTPIEHYSSSVTEPRIHEPGIPIAIFNNGALSCLEAITKYLKEERKLRFCEIAKLLNRDDRTIWGAYSHAAKKMPGQFIDLDSAFDIPLEKFTDRTYSVLESVTRFLRDECKLKYAEIGGLLNRDERTVWTAYSRMQKKLLRVDNEN